MKTIQSRSPDFFLGATTPAGFKGYFEPLRREPGMQMLLIKILHLQSPRIHYRRYRRSISFEFYLLHNLSQYITYKKIDIRNSSEYGVSVGDTQSVNFCVNEFERTCLKLRSSKFEFKFICFQQKSTLLCISCSGNLSKNFLYQFLVRNVSPPSELTSNFSSTSFYKSNTMAIPQTPFHQSYFQV